MQIISEKNKAKTRKLTALAVAAFFMSSHASFPQNRSGDIEAAITEILKGYPDVCGAAPETMERLKDEIKKAYIGDLKSRQRMSNEGASLPAGIAAAERMEKIFLDCRRKRAGLNFTQLSL